MTELACSSATSLRCRNCWTWQRPTEQEPLSVILRRKYWVTKNRFLMASGGKTAAAVSLRAPAVKQDLKKNAIDWCSFRQSDWASGYSNHKEQPDGYWINVKGTLPPELTGTYYRNGPGTYKLGEHELAHPFDGHGFILSVAIQNGRAYARTRFVETPEYKQEMRHQKILFRGSFGTQKPGGAWRNAFDIFMKNAANTHVIYLHGRLLALFEAAQPIAMDPYSLKTLGPDLLDGTIKAGASFDFGRAGNRLAELFFKAVGVRGYKYGGEHRLGGEVLTAHPKFDPDTGRWVFYKFQIKASMNPLQTASSHKPALKAVITFFELDQDMNEVSRVELCTPGYTFLHDFALTPTHIVLIISPVALDLTPFLLGVDSAAASVKWLDGKPAEVHLLGRPVVDAPAMESPMQQQQHDGGIHGIAAGKCDRHHCLDSHTTNQQQQQQQSKQQFQRQSLRQKQESKQKTKKRWGHKQAVTGTRHQPEHLVSQVPSGFVFHQANSYYDADTDCMVVVCVRMSRFPEFDKQAGQADRPFVELDMSEQPVGQLWRYDVNMTDGSHTQRCLAERQFDFPSVHPAFLGRKAQYIYGGAALHPTESRPFQCVARYDMETRRMQLWSKGPRYFMGEPQFIPRKQSQDLYVSPVHACDDGAASCEDGSESVRNLSAGFDTTSLGESLPCTEMREGDGWVLSVGFNAELQESELVLLNASDIEAGPIAILPLQNPVGYGLHGSWVPVYHGP